MNEQSSSQGPSHVEDDRKPALGFSVVRPNERRRQQILNQAQSEERAYEDYKQSRPRLEHICEAPRRLCGIDDDVPSIAEARLRQQHQLATAKVRATDKARRLREKAKEEEEEKWRLRKEEAAKKAERNREKEKEREEERLKTVRAIRFDHFNGISEASVESADDDFPNRPDGRNIRIEGFSPRRAAQNARAIREKSRQEEDERLRLMKEEARKVAEKNEEKKREKEKVDVADLRAKRLQALGL